MAKFIVKFGVFEPGGDYPISSGTEHLEAENFQDAISHVIIKRDLYAYKFLTDDEARKRVFVNVIEEGQESKIYWVRGYTFGDYCTECCGQDGLPKLG